jgi:hypothetical protein
MRRTEQGIEPAVVSPIIESILWKGNTIFAEARFEREVAIYIGWSRSLCGSGEIAEYEILFKFLWSIKESTHLRVEYTFSIGTANHPSRSATSATGFCKEPS